MDLLKILGSIFLEKDNFLDNEGSFENSKEQNETTS